MFFNMNNQEASKEVKSIKLDNPEDFIVKRWKNFASFADDLNMGNPPLTLKAIGFTHNLNDGSCLHKGYHIFSINEVLYAATGETLSEKLLSKDLPVFFHEVVEFNKYFSDSINFKKINSSNKSYLTTLEAPVPIDLKGYAYEDCDKLLVSKSGKGNIDLFISYSVDGHNYHLTVLINQSLHQAAKNIARELLLEERISKLKSK